MIGGKVILSEATNGADLAAILDDNHDAMVARQWLGIPLESTAFPEGLLPETYFEQTKPFRLRPTTN